MLEAGLELAAQPEERRLPLPVGVDALERAVMKLVEDVEGEVEVVVAGEHVAVPRQLVGRLVGGLLERLEHERADLAARLGQALRGIDLSPHSGPSFPPLGSVNPSTSHSVSTRIPPSAYLSRCRLAPFDSTSVRAWRSSSAPPSARACGSSSSGSAPRRSLAGIGSPVSRSARLPSSPWRSACQRFSAMRQPAAGGRAGSPASWPSPMARASACTTAAIAAASSTVTCASGTRTSIVPKLGWGRSSHHQTAASGMPPARRPHSSASAYSSQLASGGGTPCRGRGPPQLGRPRGGPGGRPREEGG